MSKTYSLIIGCNNCRVESEVKIPFGKTWSDGLLCINYTCPVCGVPQCGQDSDLPVSDVQDIRSFAFYCAGSVDVKVDANGESTRRFKKVPPKYKGVYLTLKDGQEIPVEVIFNGDKEKVTPYLKALPELDIERGIVNTLFKQLAQFVNDNKLGVNMFNIKTISFKNTE